VCVCACACVCVCACIAQRAPRGFIVLMCACRVSRVAAIMQRESGGRQSHPGLQSPRASSPSVSWKKTKTHSVKGQIGNSLFDIAGSLYDPATPVTSRVRQTGWWSSPQAAQLSKAQQLIFWAASPQASGVANLPTYVQTCLDRAAKAAAQAGVPLEDVQPVDWVTAYMERPTD
jgi:hypothetical protein